MREHRTVERARRIVAGHPVAVVFGVALVTRVAMALALFVAQPLTFPDEEGYLNITRAAVRGHAAFQGLGHDARTLYWFVRTFSIPLTGLMEVFGTSRLVGQLYVAVLGAAVAALTVHVALRLAPTSGALTAGLVVALLPSQVVFSSTVLRESTDWLLLVLIGLGSVALARADTRSARSLAGLGTAASLLGLYWLRPQTAFICTVVCALTVLPFAVRRKQHSAAAVGFLIIAVVPLLGGGGIAGLGLVTKNFDRLELIRTRLAVGSDTAIETPPVDIKAATAPDRTVLRQAKKAVERLPRGLAAALVRPLPWEPAANRDQRASQLENIAWVALYVAAAIGAWRLRRNDPLFVYLVSLTIGLTVLAAITQGNLGTAFRHRGQILWSLAVLAAGCTVRRHTVTPTQPAADPL